MKRTTSTLLSIGTAATLAAADVPPIPRTETTLAIGIPIAAFGAVGVGAFFLIRWIVRKVRT